MYHIPTAVTCTYVVNAGYLDCVKATSCDLLKQLDTSAFFHDLVKGADNDASGLIVALAVAKALGALKRNVSFVVLRIDSRIAQQYRLRISVLWVMDNSTLRNLTIP